MFYPRKIIILAPSVSNSRLICLGTFLSFGLTRIVGINVLFQNISFARIVFTPHHDKSKQTIVLKKVGNDFT